MRAGPSLAALSNRDERGGGKANPKTAPAFITLGGKEGHLGRGPRLWALRARRDAFAPCHVSTAAPRVRIHPLAPVTKARGLQGVTGQSGRPGRRAISRQRGPDLQSMFPCPWRAVGSAKIPPHRARVPRLAVGTQLDAQRSPCVRCGGPANASNICASGDAHGSQFRSPVSRPMRPPNTGGV